MEYGEGYHGERIIITTKEASAGAWTAKAERLEPQNRTLLAKTEVTHPSEDEARRAALSAAAAAIDRTRISRGKP